MMHSNWLTGFSARRLARKPAKRLTTRPRLAVESLEARDVPAIITVNTDLDIVDPNPAVTSLREAINDANLFIGTTDTINFAIAGGGVRTINLTSPLPTINDSVIIDGYTQPGSSPNTLAQGNNAVLNIELNGTGAGTTIGLQINASNSTIRGLVINRFTSGGPAGILLNGGTGNKISGNFIGTNAAGTGDLGQGEGITINPGSSGNTIGGILPADRNVISGNERGIVLRSTSNNLIQGNYIGTDKTGLLDLGNDIDGIRIEGTSANNIVGGTATGAGNVISGNGQEGILLIDPTVTNNTIGGNIIGLGRDGSTVIQNDSNGILVLQGAANSISGNTISGNNNNGIMLHFGASSNTISGNYIGTDAQGTTAKGNGQTGIFILNGSHSTVVDNNVISGNPTGMVLDNAGTNNSITSNKIGLDVLGTSAIGNASTGVLVSGASSASIRKNSISNNVLLGIDLVGDGVSANDGGDLDSGPNNLQNFPELSEALPGALGRVVGTLNSTPNTTFIVDFYSNRAGDGSGFGEGERYLGSKAVTTDGSGNASFDVTLNAAIGGSELVSATATDPNGNTSEFSANALANTPPILSDVPALIKVIEGEDAFFTASVSDAEQGGLGFSLVGQPAGATINAITGDFSWTPGEDQEGTFVFSVRTTDGIVTVDKQVMVQVAETNEDPNINVLLNGTDVVPGSTLAFTALATDSDLVNGLPNALTISLTGNVPAGASIDPDTGFFTWTPNELNLIGSYTFNVRVVDDGVPAKSDSQTITLNLKSAVTRFGGLLIGGTAGNDKITVAPSKDLSQLIVKNGKTTLGTFTAAGITFLEIHGLGGNDSVTISKKLLLDSFVFGGDGNDKLTGGGGNDLLVGGNGDDVLSDAGGKNVMIGGQGKDSLKGSKANKLVAGSGEDLMIAGSTSFDTDPAGLLNIFNEWAFSGDTYANRVAHLQGTAGGLNGGTFLTIATVQNDEAADKVDGSTGLDFLIVNAGDKAKFIVGETVTTL